MPTFHRASTDLRQVPFVVFGPSKSGTTWLQRIIDAHPEVSCKFQVQIAPLRASTRRRLFEQVPSVYSGKNSPFGGVFKSPEDESAYYNQTEFMEQLGQCIEGIVDTPATAYTYPRVTQDGLALQRNRLYRALAATNVLNVPGMLRCGTKCYTDLELLLECFPDAQVISIVRDGRDVAVSKRFHFAKMKLYLNGDERSGWLRALNGSRGGRAISRKLLSKIGLVDEKAFRDYNNLGTDEALLSSTAIRKFASDWVRLIEYIEHFSSRYPGQFKVVKYEDLKENSHRTTCQIFDFLKVPYTHELIDTIEESTSFASMKSKKPSSGGSFFRKGTIGDWQNHFTSANKSQFKAIAGDTLIKLGYTTDNNW